MSVNYAEQLSPYPDKGKCGSKEYIEKSDTIFEKCDGFWEMIKNSKYTVVLTGAGISTSIGIPDFRGPNGVWTLEEKGEKSKCDIKFEEAIPSHTHNTLVQLEKHNLIEFIITQNVDGLHFKSGFPIYKSAEIHGNIFSRVCHICNRKYIFPFSAPTMGLKLTGEKCEEARVNDLIRTEKETKYNSNARFKKSCRGKLKDTILDWEDEIFREDLDNCHKHSKKAELFICLGTSLQIYPCANFPRIAKRHGAKLVIVNLQKTKHDKICDLRIFGKVDDVMKIISNKLISYDRREDITKHDQIKK